MLWQILDSYFIITSITGAVYLAAQVCRVIRFIRELGGHANPRRFYTIIDGYEMEIGWQWLELSEQQREAMCNGVGPEKWPEDIRKMIDKITGFVAASKPHDVDYTVYRTRDEKLIADQRFFRNCLRIVVADAGGLIPFVLSLFVPSKLRHQAERVLLTRALYRALRMAGMSAFDAASKVDFDVHLRAEVETPVTSEWMG